MSLIFEFLLQHWPFLGCNNSKFNKTIDGRGRRLTTNPGEQAAKTDKDDKATFHNSNKDKHCDMIIC